MYICILYCIQCIHPWRILLHNQLLKHLHYFIILCFHLHHTCWILQFFTYHTTLPVYSQKTGTALQSDDPLSEMMSWNFKSQTKDWCESVVIFFTNFLWTQVVIPGLQNITHWSKLCTVFLKIKFIVSGIFYRRL